MSDPDPDAGDDADGTAVTVAITAAESTDDPGLALTYEVGNEGEAPVWLVDDDDLVWSREGDRLELSYARAPLQEGVEPFGYFDPEVRELAPGERVRKTVSLTWPQSLSGLWNDRREADPPPGSYGLCVRVGYGPTPEPDAPGPDEDVETPVLRWQREAVSDPVEVEIERSTGGEP